MVGVWKTATSRVIGVLRSNQTPGDLVAASLPTAVRALVHAVATPEDVRLRAHELGVVRRQRTVDAWALVTSVIFTVASRGPHSIAAMRVAYQNATGHAIARSAFWDRLTSSFTRLLGWLLDQLVRKANDECPTPPGIFAKFRDVRALDSSVVPVHTKLTWLWRGTRKTAEAALKVHTTVRVFTGELLRYRITPEVLPDCKAAVFGTDIRGVLFLFDMGYSSPSLWAGIDRRGGYFLTRLPADRDPKIVRNLRRHRGRARAAAGTAWSTFVEGIHRRYVDVEAQFRVHIAGRAGRRGRTELVRFRVVGVLNDQSGEYHRYVTNIPIDWIPAEHIRDAYRLRWEVETFYKLAKSGAALDELPSVQPHIVRAMVIAALFRVTTATMLRARHGHKIPAGRRVNPIAWVRHVIASLGAVSAALAIEDGEDDNALFPRAVLDPNRRRTPTREKFGRPTEFRFEAG